MEHLYAQQRKNVGIKATVFWQPFVSSGQYDAYATTFYTEYDKIDWNASSLAHVYRK